MYDPVVGRMMGVDNLISDPTGTQFYNRYSYVWNNPLKWIDPSGNGGILPWDCLAEDPKFNFRFYAPPPVRDDGQAEWEEYQRLRAQYNLNLPAGGTVALGDCGGENWERSSTFSSSMRPIKKTIVANSPRRVPTSEATNTINQRPPKQHIPSSNVLSPERCASGLS